MLRSVDQLAGRIQGRVGEELPGYRHVPAREHRSTVGATCRQGIAATVSGRPAQPDELEAARRLGRRRAEQGVAGGELLQSFRISYREGWNRCQEVAREIRATGDDLLDLSERLWRWTDELMIEAATAHRDAEVAAFGEATESRLALLRAVLLGEHPRDGNLAALCAHHGLDVAEPVVPFAVAAADDSALFVERRLARIQRRRARVSITGVIDGVVAGLSTEAPPPMTGTLTARGPTVPLEASARSFAEARRALAVGVALGRTGGTSLDELGLWPAVHSDPRTGRVQAERVLGPLRALPRGGPELVTTLQTLLDNDLHVERTAAALHVHPNTLRHRIGRIERASGLDLRRLEDVMSAWWALGHRRLSAPPPRVS